jgi:two-component SAPR family response regulator
MDHGSLLRFFQKNFDVDFKAVATTDAAIGELRQGNVDLVLVNRQFDADGTEGLDFIDQMKADAALADVPVMLITNFPEYAEQAVEHGAAPGFGKAELNSTGLVTRLRSYLS